MQSGSEPRVAVPGSERSLPAGVRLEGEPDLAQRADVTVLVRPPAHAKAAFEAATVPAIAARTYMTRAAFADRMAAGPDDLAAVTAFAAGAGLEVLGVDPVRRSIVLGGTLGSLAAAFDVRLGMARGPAGRYRARVGAIWIPAALGGIVVGVFGFDDRPQARSHARILAPAAAAQAAAASPLYVAAAYDYPEGNGAGQTVALIELGGGFVQADLDAYFMSLGVGSPKVTAVAVDGSGNAPTGDGRGPDGEVMLDIEIVGAIAPAAAVAVYFAPNTDRGFLDAVTTAIHDSQNAPSIVSISWGGPESTWTAQSTSAFDAAFADAATLGVTVLVAAGDGGYTDGVSDGAAHVDFPASSPHVTACGGTRLDLGGGIGAALAGEVVWNELPGGGATGGGISAVFPVPTYQSAVTLPASVNAGAAPGRGVPDLAGNADPQTGYNVRIDGAMAVVGGTSAVAPLVAGLVARLNATARKKAGFLNPALYATPAALHDVTSGTNGAYVAGPGWDACTGLGSPSGTRLAAALFPTA